MEARDEEKKGRPFFAFGWVVAYGTIAIGMNAAGVVAIGLNAAGSLIAIGGNAAAPISIGAINAFGIVAVGGVNAIGPWGLAGVNGMGSPKLALVVAVVYWIGMAFLRSRKRTAPGVPTAEVPSPVLHLAEIVDQHETWTRARSRLDPSRERLELDDGEKRLSVRVGGAVLGDRFEDGQEVFVRLRGALTPKSDLTDYRHAVSETTFEAVELRPVPIPRSLATRLGLAPWTVANTHVVGATILLAALIATLAR